MARTAAMASPCLAGGKGAKVPRRRVDTLAKTMVFTGVLSLYTPAQEDALACMSADVLCRPVSHTVMQMFLGFRQHAPASRRDVVTACVLLFVFLFGSP